ncbi:MAG: UDP-N-acetylmuramate--L-alanine ligase [Bacillota bacterium]
MQTIHFIAIGGQSMSGIARIMLDRGYRVTGSDLRASNLTERLQEMGAEIHIGHKAAYLGDPDMVVVSSAIHEDNPELALARSRGIPVLHRMDALLMAVEGKRLVAVAGSAGKTTTTSMVAWILTGAGTDPTYLVGGEFTSEGNAHLGKGEFAVFETDESDGSFLKVRPDIALATNIDNDHLEHWGSMEALEQGFYRFLDGTVAGGARIACFDDPRLRRYAQEREGTQTYSTTGGLPSTWQCRDVRPNGWGSTATILRAGREVAALELVIPGAHNVQDALGAIAAACAAGLSPEEAAAQMSTFRGVKRRLEKIGEFGGVLVLDDFAHHPSKIKASIAAVRSVLPGRRVIVVFQPHRFARTRLLKAEFGTALSDADSVYVTGIYAGPGEDEEAGVSSALISDAVASQGRAPVRLVPDMYDAAQEAALEARPGDIVLTVGAGDIWTTHKIIEDTLLKRT